MKHQGEYRLNIVPSSWQRMLDPILKPLSSQRVTLWCYIDNRIVLGLSRAEALKYTSMLVDLLLSLAPGINYPKSELTLGQHLIWIGFELDLQNG